MRMHLNSWFVQRMSGMVWNHGLEFCALLVELTLQKRPDWPVVLSGTAWRYCPLRLSTCSSTTAAWPACLSPWLRCTRTTRTMTASSTWPTPHRRCSVTDLQPLAIAAQLTLFLLYVSFSLMFKTSPAAVNRKQAVCVYIVILAVYVCLPFVFAREF